MSMNQYFHVHSSRILQFVIIIFWGIFLMPQKTPAQQATQSVNYDRHKVDQRAEHQKALRELTIQADLIVVGNVTALRSQWDAKKSGILTLVTISNGEILKGASPGSEVTVVTPGGEVDGIGELYSHTPQFKMEEDVVVFLKRGTNQEYIMSDGERAKFTVVKDNASGKKFIPNVGALETFARQIKDRVKENNQLKSDR